MTSAAALNLTRVTVVATARRVEVCLPGYSVVGELLPHLMRHTDAEIETAYRDGGWVLRRADGTVLDPIMTLPAQGVREGEVLDLVPRRAAEQEPPYDDVVDAIAVAARDSTGAWDPAMTRRFGFAATVAALVAGLVQVLHSGPSWTVAGAVSAVLSILLLATAAALSRAVADATAGAVVGCAGTGYAVISALFLTARRAPAPASLGLLVSHVSAPQFLAVSAALAVSGALCYLGVAAHQRLFVPGMFAGAVGACCVGLHRGGVPAVSVAAVAVAVVVGLIPAYPALAGWLAERSALHTATAYAAVARPATDAQEQPWQPAVMVAAVLGRELLTGLLTGCAVVAVASIGVLAESLSPYPMALAGTAVAVMLLRYRLMGTQVRRHPLPAGGLLGLVAGVLVLARVHDLWQRAAAVALLAAAMAVALGASLRTGDRGDDSGQDPSPAWRVTVRVVELAALLALAPLACAVLLHRR